jgi:ribonucleoside-diphosphate reductase alpha chain
MEKNNQILSDIVIFNKYAKYLYKKNRRETWEEICDRYEDMMKKKYPSLSVAIVSKMKLVRDKKVLMSMRAAQFAGAAITKNESRIYNCAFLPIDDHRAFSEVMFLLLGGTGVGFSVQYHHINCLPEIRKPLKQQKYLVGDSIEGWADSVRHLMASYFGMRKTKPIFDFSDIRPKGSRLVTAGGKAPGAEPLKRCLFNIELLLERKGDGDKLTTLEAHDIICYIADAVLAGGIRRAALISLFSADDESMLGCKAGAWWEQNPQRGRANNSAVVLRHRVTKRFFDTLWAKIEDSNCGEPGIYFSNDRDWGCNPCCEIALRPFQFCNLTEINAGNIRNQADLDSRAAAASFFGTLQAGFTNFHYLRSIWQTTTQQESLIGVGITGICNGEILKYSLEQAAKTVEIVNKNTASIIGISPAARLTTVKPSGTTSCVVGTSSGIHAWHSQYYIRRMQCTKDEALYIYLERHHPELVKDYKAIPNTAVIEIPQTAPIGAIVRDKETALDLLERVSKFNIEWVREGHGGGSNSNNVSATVSIEEGEWEDVREWMWKNKHLFNGLSVLPYDGGAYTQAPFENIDKPTFNKLYTQLKTVDLTKVMEVEDNTDLSNEIACAGGSCEVVNI